MNAFEDRPERDAEIALVGRSNVGKSTLMRELVGHQVETGRKPGVTRGPNHFDWTGADLVVTDLPGFGFMSGVPEDVRETIKTEVVQYLERWSANIVVAILVLDGKAAVDIIDRHQDRGEVPHDVELYHFLRDLDIPTIVAVNKMDKVDDRDETLNAIADRLGIPTPWQQWQDVIAPISAKRGQVDALQKALEEHCRAQGNMELLGPLRS